ncbi:MAG: M48 family metalloprotease [Waddliaceae bacterium]
MSLVSGFFTLPFQHAKAAYDAATFNFSLTFNGQPVHKNDNRYDTVLKQLPGSHIKEEMQPFLEKVGLRKDPIFYETPNPGIFSTVGADIFKNSDTTVLITPGIYEADKHACTWSIKHEIMHIKSNDHLTIPCVSGVCQLAAAVFGMCSFSFLPAVATATLVGLISQSLFSKWQEAKADDFAIKNSSDEELKGGRRFLMTVQELALENRNTFWSRICISSNGDTPLDIMHPSTSSRVKKIEMALRKRGVELNKDVEMQKIKDLKSFMKIKKQEFITALQQGKI